MPIGTDIITFGCPKCGTVCSAGTVLAGKQGKCKACGEVVTIPEPRPAMPTSVAERQTIQSETLNQHSSTDWLSDPKDSDQFWWWPMNRIAAYMLAGFLILAAIATLALAGPVGAVINVFVWYAMIASIRLFYVRVIRPARTRRLERMHTTSSYLDSPKHSYVSPMRIVKGIISKKRNEREAQRHQYAESAFHQSSEEKAFIPSQNTSLTRRIMKAGVYHVATEDTGSGSAVIGYLVPDRIVIDVLREMGHSVCAEARLVELLRYMFKINAEAKQNRPHLATVAAKDGEKKHLLQEACRLAAKQNHFTWGWIEDPRTYPITSLRSSMVQPR